MKQNPEHEALQTAFEAFNNQNYTVTVSDEAYSEEDKPYDVTYHIYRTDSAGIMIMKKSDMHIIMMRFMILV